MRRFSLPALVLLCALYATTGQPDPKKAKPPKPPKDMKIPPEMKPPKGPKPPKPPMPPGAKGAKPDKKFDAKNPDFMKHKPPTQDRDRVRGPPGKKGKRPDGPPLLAVGQPSRRDSKQAYQGNDAGNDFDALRREVLRREAFGLKPSEAKLAASTTPTLEHWTATRP